MTSEEFIDRFFEATDEIAEAWRPDPNAEPLFAGLGYDPGRVDWFDVGVDVFGIVGDVAFNFPPAGTVVWGASEVAEIATLGKAWDQLDMGDPSSAMIQMGVVFAKAARLAPEAGWIGNAASLSVNLSKGYYIDKELGKENE
jgi:hypothetical protein